VLRLVLAVLIPFEEGSTGAAGGDRQQSAGIRPEGSA
jgi:hypothetical protein